MQQSLAKNGARSVAKVQMARAYREMLERLPEHLQVYAVDQNYQKYSPRDHAVWRYIMRQNVRFLEQHGHPTYLTGLGRTGISLHRIPRIEEMNSILQALGWGAVAVDGFVPPGAFMEFHRHRVLLIASDMRQLENIEYTPAPDIVHEAAGHAPMIADADYADYLQKIGELGSLALESKQDQQLYQAIRLLSDIKERPGTSAQEIAAAEQALAQVQQSMGPASELAQLSKLFWWTVEYGLFGSLDRPQIYGAGLLSSIGEAKSCLDPKVKKVPYSIEAKDISYDITTRQPQLFVTPDFSQLSSVLDQFRNTMAHTLGGVSGIKSAIAGGTPVTVQYSSGIEFTGVMDAVALDDDGNPSYLWTRGATSLAFQGQPLTDLGCHQLAEGFSSPVGQLVGFEGPPERARLKQLGLSLGKNSTLRFTSGVCINGRLQQVKNRGERIVLLLFAECTVSQGQNIWFRPDMGTYVMALGGRITSVYRGAHDSSSLQQTTQPPARYPQTPVQKLYQKLSLLHTPEEHRAGFDDLWRRVQAETNDEWLLALELLQNASYGSTKKSPRDEILHYLHCCEENQPHLRELIRQGIDLYSA